MQINNKKYESNWWSIEYPEEWETEQNEDCTTFYNPDGVGALQISSYRKDEQISESEIFDVATDDITETNKLQKIKEENYQGFIASYAEENDFWKKYYIWKDRIMVYITYNCEIKDKNNEELTTIENILKTLKINA